MKNCFLFKIRFSELLSSILVSILILLNLAIFFILTNVAIAKLKKIAIKKKQQYSYYELKKLQYLQN